MDLQRRISIYSFRHLQKNRRRKYWQLIWIITTVAACDVLILFVLFKILLPLLLDDTPYLLPEHSQEYSHITTFSTSGSSVTALTFSPDGNTLAHGGYNKIRLWDTKTEKELFTLREHDVYVTSLVFSPDGKTLASSSMSMHNPVILYDTATGHAKTNLTGHTSWITSLGYSPDGNTVVGASKNGEITAWDSNTGRTVQPKLGTMAYAIPGRFIPYGSHYHPDYIIVRWNWFRNYRNVGNTPANFQDMIESEAFNDDGIIAMFPGPNTIPIYLSSHTYRIGTLAFSPNGKILASSSRSEFQPFYLTRGKIHLWDIETGIPTATLRTPGQKVNTLAFSPDGNYLASNGSKRLSDSQKILIWDLTTDELISMIDTDSFGEITTMVFSPDNKTLASGNEYGSVHLWDITGQIRK